MADAVSVNIEYGQYVFQCPTEEEGFMCDLADPCPSCPLLSDTKRIIVSGIYLHEDKKPSCFGTGKVLVKPNVPRFECVMCSWELQCYDSSKQSTSESLEKHRRRTA